MHISHCRWGSREGVHTCGTTGQLWSMSHPKWFAFDDQDLPSRQNDSVSGYSECWWGKRIYTCSYVYKYTPKGRHTDFVLLPWFLLFMLWLHHLLLSVSVSFPVPYMCIHNTVKHSVYANMVDSRRSDWFHSNCSYTTSLSIPTRSNKQIHLKQLQEWLMTLPWATKVWLYM